MANMIEQSLLCKVLDAPDLEILHSNGVIEEMFLTCKDEIHFIIEHYNSYKQMPDKLTFLGRFKDFQMLEVTESTDYLIVLCTISIYSHRGGGIYGGRVWCKTLFKR